MNATTEPATSETPTTTIADVPATPPEADAGQPTVDTSLPEGFSLYEPTLKKGVHRALCQIVDIGPAVNQNDNSFMGVSVSVATLVELPDEIGGKLPAGTRFNRLTIWTTPSQYRTPDAANKNALSLILALNNVPVNRKSNASAQQAIAAYNGLQPNNRLPAIIGKEDTNPAHYEQWKGTQVVAVLKAEEKDGETRVNCLGLEAASTAKS